MNCAKEKNLLQTSDNFYYLYGYLPYRYFYFMRFSPDTRDIDYVCHVFPSGNIEYRYNFYVDYSCGRKHSPDTIGPSYSKDVTYTGEVMGNYANGSVGESYGMIYTTNKQIQISLSGRRLRLRPCVLRGVRWYRRRRLEFRQFLRADICSPEVDIGHVAYYVFSDGVVYSWNIVNSYGINSPDRTGYVTAYFVESDGNVYSGNGVDWAMTDSYGLSSPRSEMTMAVYACWINSMGSVYQYLDRSEITDSYGRRLSEYDV